MDAVRHVRRRIREHERALENVSRRNPMCDVDDLRLWCDPLDHAVTGADEVVLEPEVAQKGDEHAATSTRRVAHGSDEAVERVRIRLADDLDAGLPCSTSGL